MPNSTILANLQLQIQDNLNPGQTPLNRIVPQFVLGSSNTAIYSGYQYLLPTGGFANIIFQGILVPVVFVRNAGQDGNVLVTTQTNISSTTNNSFVLAPGGIFAYFSALDIKDPNVGIQVLSIENDTANAVLYEYLWAY